MNITRIPQEYQGHRS